MCIDKSATCDFREDCPGYPPEAMCGESEYHSDHLDIRTFIYVYKRTKTYIRISIYIYRELYYTLSMIDPLVVTLKLNFTLLISLQVT